MHDSGAEGHLAGSRWPAANRRLRRHVRRERGCIATTRSCPRKRGHGTGLNRHARFGSGGPFSGKPVAGCQPTFASACAARERLHCDHQIMPTQAWAWHRAKKAAFGAGGQLGRNARPSNSREKAGFPGWQRCWFSSLIFCHVAGGKLPCGILRARCFPIHVCGAMSGVVPASNLYISLRRSGVVALRATLGRQVLTRATHPSELWT